MGPPAIILAGGRGTRMGGADKALLALHGRPLLDHILARLRPQVAAIALNANGDPGRFAAWRLEVLADPWPGHPGPLAGILAGMRWAAALGHAHVVSVPGDTPFLATDLVALLTAGCRDAGVPIACAAAEGRLYPVVALWPVALADALEARLRAGQHKVADFIAMHGAIAVDFPAVSLFNVNQPGDLAAAHASQEPPLSDSRPPFPPFTRETAMQKVRAAEDGWNGRNPDRVALAYTEDSRWRNRAEFLRGRGEIAAFLARKWARELDYRLIKELWAFTEDRIAVRFAYEWHDDSGQWFRSYGNENWEFDARGLMQARHASINDLPIMARDRKFHWEAPGPRPMEHPGLSELGL
jgi:molybdenum cofactor guanylyltransferase